MEIERNPLEQSLDTLLDHAPCGYLSTLADGTILQVNETLVAMTGHDRPWLLSGKRFAELLSIPGRVYHDTHFGPLLDIQGFVKEVAFELQRRDGSRLSVLVNAVRKRGESAQGDLTLITVFDATDRRRYEREILLAQRRAEEAADAEKKARKAAEDTARIKDEFLAMVSHELRTPLNAILGWTQLLQEQPGITQDQQEGLSVIERNAQVQAKLINDLLDMSRIIAGKMRLDVQNVLLADVVDAALATVHPAANAKGVRLQKVLDPAVLVAGDPGRLQQIFWNLLTNSVKFTPKGGFVRVVVQRINSHVEISVIDSGQGMTNAFIAHAFEPFRQSDTGATQRTGGLGLGLSIVKSLVEMHGGTIRAISEGQDKGSTFIISLPVAVVHTPQDGAQRMHPLAAVAEVFEVRGISLHGIKVLVVDDEPDAREMVRRVLAASGAEVMTAGSVAEALQRLDEHTPDVLVSDVGLPGEDGYELIRRVRMRGGSTGRVRAAALTAFTRLEDRTRAMLAGFQMHLSKPVDARELVVTVAALARK